MEKYTLAVTIEVEVSVHRDPRDIAYDIFAAVRDHVIHSIRDTRYAVRSGDHQPIPGEIKAPKIGVVTE